MALGLGTMIGWKRIVVTVGEKIGKDHLTYGQGAAAEITAMATIGAADMWGLPVSTTHVLSSGVAGTMAANGTGLQWGTVRNLVAGLGADSAGRHDPVGLRCSGPLPGCRNQIFVILSEAKAAKRPSAVEEPLSPVRTEWSIEVLRLRRKRAASAQDDRVLTGRVSDPSQQIGHTHTVCPLVIPR